MVNRRIEDLIEDRAVAVGAHRPRLRATPASAGDDSTAAEPARREHLRGEVQAASIESVRASFLGVVADEVS
jgi:hypothetical protein